MTQYISPLSPEIPQKPGEVKYWGSLFGSAKSLALCSAANIADIPIVILTADIKAMENMKEEISFFENSQGNFPVLSFPDWETLPYDSFSPYQDIISDRLQTLSQLTSFNKGILVVPISTVMHRLLPVNYLSARSFKLDVNEGLDTDSFRKRLTDTGYRMVSQVMEHGDYASRGSILDIFPMGAQKPYRIDLLDNIIDSIRVFDPESQKSVSQVDAINILPASEISLTEESIVRFRSNWRRNFEGNPATSTMYNDISNRIAPPGIEYYLPLFYESTNLLFDYLADKYCVIYDEGAIDAAEKFWCDVKNRYNLATQQKSSHVLSPEQIFTSPDELIKKLDLNPHIHITNLSVRDKSDVCNYATRTPERVPIDIRGNQPLGILKRFIGGFEGRALIIAESAGRRETILDLFRNNDIFPHQYQSWKEFINGKEKLGLTVSALEQGAYIEAPALVLISETELFGERVQQRRLRKRKQNDTDAIVRSLAELTIGSPVVHEENGIGRYKGLITLNINGILNEFIHLEYDRGDKLYVPVTSLNLISRYIGADADNAPLHRLGSGQWHKSRLRAEKRIYDVAAELLELHARRAAKSGKNFIIDENEYRAFVQGFPFEETPDQEDAINAVLTDMMASEPMDRLVCGDAGFGKTEVAMRAAFICVNNNRQVAILVPTTLLAQQHYQNFCDRFANWPIKVEVLSRFISRKEQLEVTKGLGDGRVDIIIGTHRLLQNDIKFKQLGLVIIDEEHRFGVRQKEKFKALRSEVDVLTLTATPIPRTLNLAISDLRGMSIIATPPSRRLAVKTFVNEWKDGLLREAIQREIMRGGQVYFLHNEVDSIEKMSERIHQLIPEARVRFAHGQMPEKQLEQVMLDFYHRRFNILVCTTIIESGIDVPTANTIIINRADKLGLAQLYQLRGRVGRSHHRAYAYLLIPMIRSITKDALKRLQAVESLEDLGIGFTLAIHDLEIRGAGEILGEEQSGQIHEIGFSLYMELLERAVRALKSGMQPQLDRPLDHGAEIDIHAPALIPEYYLPDVHSRLILYKRIASANSQDELTALHEELIDRFGPLPEPVKMLFDIARLKLRIAPLGIKKIDLAKTGGRILFDKITSIDSGKIIQLIQEKSDIYKLDGSEKLRIINELPEPELRLKFLHELFDMISAREAA
jgi:transcription-repair coupling factor (superfamily II helicase)